MRKKVDNRVRILVENAIAQRHRAFFVMVGDRGKDQIINLHYMLSKITTKKPSVLWCYKNELGFSSHRKKRMKQLKSKIQKGLWDPNVDDPFELFVSSTRIRYCYYKETSSILGQTFGMCVLQDFEAITPNILCRAIETVEGGGIVCVLLKSMSSLKQLYQLTMDAHSRFSTRTLTPEGGVVDVEPRFNERFILSLADCPECLVVDDELNILPISRHAKKIAPLGLSQSTEIASSKKSAESAFSLAGVPDTPELKELKENMKGSAMSPLVNLSVTIDQATALLSFIESISEKSLNGTVSLTAGRGRGKSVTLGLSIAAAVAYSYSNIFVTAPNPENVGTLFEFVQKGLVALGYKEHVDFELVQGEVVSTSSDAAESTTQVKQLVRINVFREHRQTIQYITPNDIAFAKQAEILVIDEAAAIPLSLITKLMGPYFVFLSSTINGYEGTGRALSLKLLQEIKQGRKPGSNLSGRTLKELVLETPIRYSLGDPIENWLNNLLCLDATTPVPLTGGTFALPQHCSLYEVNRDALFSYHNASEAFLHKMMSLFVSSHYKNSPNDLLLLSDAPAHHIFVLLPPVSEAQTELPDVYVAIQVAFEGAISKDVVRNALNRGLRQSGDLLPWTLAQNFVDEDFGGLNGARIVRIAVHPALHRMGYGSEAMKQVVSYLEGSGDSSLLNEGVGSETAVPSEDVEEEFDELDVDDESKLQTSKNGKKTAGADDNDSAEDENEDEEDGGDEGEDVVDEDEVDSSIATEKKEKKKKEKVDLSNLQTEHLSVRDAPPLLVPCKEKPIKISVDYVGTSFGLTLDLFKFHNRLGFQPVYLRQSSNDITGEHSVIMLRALTSGRSAKSDWLSGFVRDFKNRLVNLFGSSFSHLPINVCLSLVAPAPKARANDDDDVADTVVNVVNVEGLPPVTHKSVYQFFSSHDLLRLDRYSQQLIDRALIADLLPTVAWLLLTQRLQVQLPHLQTAILLALGAQRKSVDAIAKEFNIAPNQVLALFNKAMHAIQAVFQEMLESQAREGVAEVAALSLPDELPTQSFEEEMEEGAKVVNDQLAERKSKMMKGMTNRKVQQYSLAEVHDSEIAAAASNKTSLTSVCLKSKRKLAPAEENTGFHIVQKKKRKQHHR